MTESRQDISQVRSIAGQTAELTRTVARALALGRPGDRLTSRRVSVVSDAKGLHDDWERRIVEIGDGRSVGELVAIIFGEELKAGAWTADIGLWSDLFSRSVIRVIEDLECSGYIRLTGTGSA